MKAGQGNGGVLSCSVSSRCVRGWQSISRESKRSLLPSLESILALNFPAHDYQLFLAFVPLCTAFSAHISASLMRKKERRDDAMCKEMSAGRAT